MQSFVDVLSLHARERPGKTAFVMLTDSGTETDSLTYAALDLDARRIAVSLRAFLQPGRRVLILHCSGLDFIRAFMGCQYAGLVTVPLSLASRHDQYRRQVEHVIRDADVSAIVADAKWSDVVRRWMVDSPYARLPVVTVRECLAGVASAWSRRDFDSEGVSLIQYTSGSTGQPKGVMVRNRNLIHNSCLVRDFMGYDQNLVGGGWLPFFHDMGLMGLILQPIFLGATAVMMSPASFIRQPASWLKAISRHGIQSSGGPAFCFEHCLSRIHEPDLSGIDLNCWRLCFSGAEPVCQATIRRFFARFKPYGLRESAFYPCYAMAEATLFVSGGRQAESYRAMDVDADRLEKRQVVVAVPTTSRRQTLASCGTAPGFELQIVDPSTRRRIGSGRVGEVWLRGGSIAAGYWGKPHLSREIFGAVLQGESDQPWFRTGDLGFLDHGELFICGRLKDIMIVGGRTIYPQDIETRIAGLSPLLKGDRVVVFGIDTGGKQSVAIICEMSVKAIDSTACKALVKLIRSTIATEFDVPVSRVVLAAEGSIARTTAGKPQRQQTQQHLNAGCLDTIWDDQPHMLTTSLKVALP